jgi:hypothetical protein
MCEAGVIADGEATREGGFFAGIAGWGAGGGMAALGQEEAFDSRVQMVDNPHQVMNAALG